MLIKFFPHGQGDGAGPVNYVTRPEGRENAPPEVLRGDPALTRDLIDSTDRQWRYTSGVVSFAREDAPSEDQQRFVMDEFERTAFAGLDADQYDILWVRHTHTEGARVELHFVTPRTELASGKALNIAPPGWEGLYGSLQDTLNIENGWVDPHDPDRARDLQRANESELRSRDREGVGAYVEGRVEAGLIVDRASLVQSLEEAGFAVTRQGEHYITVKDPEGLEGEKGFRLKGALYEQDWTRDAYLERALGREDGLGPGADRGRDSERAAEVRRELEERIEGRARTHGERYGRSPDENGIEHARAAALAALDRGLVHDRDSRLDRDSVGRDMVDAPGPRRDPIGDLGRDDGASERGRQPDALAASNAWGLDPHARGWSSARDGAGKHEFDARQELHAGRQGEAVHRTPREELSHGPVDAARARIDDLRGRVDRWVSERNARVSRWFEKLRGEIGERLREALGHDRARADEFGRAHGDYRGQSAAHGEAVERGLGDLRQAAEGLRAADREFGAGLEKAQLKEREQERERSYDRGYDMGM